MTKKQNFAFERTAQIWGERQTPIVYQIEGETLTPTLTSMSKVNLLSGTAILKCRKPLRGREKTLKKNVE